MPKLGEEEKILKPVLIIPYRDPADAKTRLSGVMTDRERSDLSKHMFRHVLAVAREVLSPDEILVVTRSAAVRQLCRGECSVLVEKEGGLNPALELAIDQARQNGADIIGIVHADLPRLEPDDLRIILDIDEYEVGIAPDIDRSGTNALTFAASALIRPHFGHGSFKAHVNEISQAGLEVWPVVTPGLMQDVDWPTDLELTREKNGPSSVSYA